VRFAEGAPRIRARWLAACAAALLLSASEAPARKEPREQEALEPERVHDAVVRGSHVLVGQSGALVVYDFADPANPRVLGKLSRPGHVLAVAVSGDLAYVALGSRGVGAVDLSHPAEPVLLGRYDTPGSVRRVAARDRIVAVADGSRGLEIVSFASPEKPRGLASIPTRDAVRGVSWKGALLATAEGSAGVRLFDMTAPATPRRLAPVERQGVALDAALCGDGVLVVAAGDAGLRVWDVRDPSRPREAGGVATDGRARAVDCAAGIAAVGCGDHGVLLADVRNVDAPRRLSATPLGRAHPAERVHLAGTILLVAADAGGLGVLSIEDPVAPVTLLPRPRKMTIEFP